MLGLVVGSLQPVLLLAALGAGLAVAGPSGVLPAAEALGRHLRMELEGIGRLAVAEGMVGKERTAREVFRALWNTEGVKMRLAYDSRSGKMPRPCSVAMIS